MTWQAPIVTVEKQGRAWKPKHRLAELLERFHQVGFTTEGLKILREAGFAVEEYKPVAVPRLQRRLYDVVR